MELCNDKALIHHFATNISKVLYENGSDEGAKNAVAWIPLLATFINSDIVECFKCLIKFLEDSNTAGSRHLISSFLEKLTKTEGWDIKKDKEVSTYTLKSLECL